MKAGEKQVEWRVRTKHPEKEGRACVQLHNCDGEDHADAYASMLRSRFPQATVTVQTRSVTPWTDGET